jgi:hypothetical protein
MGLTSIEETLTEIRINRVKARRVLSPLILINNEDEMLVFMDENLGEI